MVNVSEFKEEKKPFITVLDVMNAKDRVALIVDEATIVEFKSTGGNAYKKLVVPVVFEGRHAKIGVYADVSQRLGLALGHETKAWIGRKVAVKVAGAKTPYITLDLYEENKDTSALSPGAKG